MRIPIAASMVTVSEPASRILQAFLAAALATSFDVPFALAQPAETRPKAAPAGTLMIIAPMSLAVSAGAWADYRGECGWTVVRHELPGDDPANGRADRIRASIRAAHARCASSGGDPFAVLLLGDVDVIPAWQFRQTEPSLVDADGPHYASDHPYQLMDDEDELPDIALGRVAVSSDTQALAVLQKIKAYESHAVDGKAAAAADELDFSSRRITYVAGEGRFGAADALIESMFIAMVDTLVPPAFDLSMCYASAGSVYCPPPSKLADTVLERLGEGSLLFNYIGHGSQCAFDSLHWAGVRVPMLRTADLDRLHNGSGQRPIALLTCCSAGWYDLPGGEFSLGEAMLLHPAGPVAVLAASRPSHPYANTVLQKDVTQLLLISRVKTVGELDRRATQSMLQIDALDRQLDAMARPLTSMMQLRGSLAECRLMHARMYNLLGDPATVIRRPSLSIRIEHSHDGVVRGHVDGMVRGQAIITVESPRTAPLHADRLQQPLGEDDPALEQKAAANEALANDRIIARFEAEVIDSRFESRVDMTDGVPVATVKVFASGENAAGGRVNAFGAVPISTLERSSSPALPRD